MLAIDAIGPVVMLAWSASTVTSSIVPMISATANMCFLLATHTGLLSLAGVLTSLYPATTVLLAVGLLHEHTSKVQRVGLALAATAIVLITV